MVIIHYIANLKYDRQTDMYEIEIPEIEGCYTCSPPSYEQAAQMGKEILSIVLAECLEIGEIIPRPKNNKPTESQIAIRPEPDIALALWLRWQREDRQLSQEQMAKQCELDMNTYQRLESANEPAMKILTKLEHGLGENIFAL